MEMMNNFQTALFSLTPETFKAHVLHQYDQNFRETNCYSDLVIEIVNGLGLNPIACLGYTLAADFEGDQWTFGKPSHHDLQQLYGIRIEELSLYRPLQDQIVTQVSRGAVPLLEADAFHLPDAEGIDYRTSHVKTTIGINYINVEEKVMYYFHNATYAKLEGEDFDGVLAPLIAAQKGYLPPYCEMAKLDQVFALSEQKLREIAVQSAAFHFNKGPKRNPFDTFLMALAAHQQTIITQGESAYHAYTFVAPRQLGAAHQLGAHFLRWLDANNQHLTEAAREFENISNLSKSLVLKLARVAFTKKLANLDGMVNEMAASWQHANDELRLFFAEQ